MLYGRVAGCMKGLCAPRNAHFSEWRWEDIIFIPTWVRVQTAAGEWVLEVWPVQTSSDVEMEAICDAVVLIRGMCIRLMVVLCYAEGVCICQQAHQRQGT